MASSFGKQMPINLIVNVTEYKNKLAIGVADGLLFRLKGDLKLFKRITTGSLSSESKIDRNVVVMGRKTWFSIPKEKRPLPGRLNIVLTNDSDYHGISGVPKVNNLDRDVYFVTFGQFTTFYNSTNANVFVIGGAQIYDLFMHGSDPQLRPKRVYMTETKGPLTVEPDTFMSHLPQWYKLIGVSEKHTEGDYTYRLLQYDRASVISQEHQYATLLKAVLDKGDDRKNRTGRDTIALFGRQLRFDISTSIPLMTLKRTPFRQIVEELLWVIRGDTDAGILKSKNVNIWNDNTSREFLDKRGLDTYPEGVMGPSYGWQMRFFGAPYSVSFSDTHKIDT